MKFTVANLNTKQRGMAMFPLNEGSGSYVQGGRVFAQLTSEVTWSTNTYGSALNFTGSSASMVTGNGVYLDGLTSFSMTARFKTSTNKGTTCYLFTCPSNLVGSNCLDIGLSSTGVFGHAGLNTGFVSLVYGVNYADNAWHEVTFTLAAGSAILYFDGWSRSVSFPGAGSYIQQSSNPTGQFTIGNFSTSYFAGYPGLIDKAELRDYALNNKQVLANFQARDIINFSKLTDLGATTYGEASILQFG